MLQPNIFGGVFASDPKLNPGTLNWILAIIYTIISGDVAPSLLIQEWDEPCVAILFGTMYVYIAFVNS